MPDIGTIRFLGDLQRVELKPGDKLVLKVPTRIPHDMADKLSERMRGYFPDHDVIVLCDGMELGVVSPEAA